MKPNHLDSTSGQLIFDNRIDGQVLTSQEASLFLKISPKTLTKLVNNGLIPCRKVGVQTRFLVRDLVEWMRGE